MDKNSVTGVSDGELYDANYDPRVSALRKRAKSYCFEYNVTRPGSDRERYRLLKKLLGGCGLNITIEPPFFCDYGTNITVGENFYANHGLIILDGAKVCIGDNVFIAPDVGIHTAGHPFDAERRNQGLEYALPVTVGHNVWIGAAVTLLPGVTIGNNSIVGAGAVITKDIPSDVIAVGNPCRVLREISDKDRLQKQF